MLRLGICEGKLLLWRYQRHSCRDLLGFPQYVIYALHKVVCKDATLRVPGVRLERRDVGFRI